MDFMGPALSMRSFKRLISVLVLLALAVRKIVLDRLHHRSDCSTGVCSGDCAHCHMQH